MAKSAGKEDPESSINGVKSSLRAASPAVITVVGGRGRDNLVRGSLRKDLLSRAFYGNPVASLSGGAVVTRGKVSVDKSVPSYKDCQLKGRANPR